MRDLIARLDLAAIEAQTMARMLTAEKPRMASSLDEIAVLLGKAATALEGKK